VGGFCFAEESKKEAAPASKYEPAVRTYFLKHITPREVEKSLKLYFLSISADSGSNMFTVSILQDKIAEFEKLLEKIDVEKKKIIFRIFTVIATNESAGDDIRSEELKKVIAELKSVLSFKSYKLDGISLLTVKEGSESGHLTLSTKLPDLNVQIYDVRIKGDTPGKRTVEIEDLRLSEYKVVLIETGTSIQENGYLVAGVSRVGKNGDALVLVINAEIK
jgi:hypothetical protein